MNKPFPWRRGMTALILFRDHPCAEVNSERLPHLVSRVNADGRPDLSEHAWMGIEDHDPQPDKADGATMGALLAAVRQAFGRPRLTASPGLHARQGQEAWYIQDNLIDTDYNALPTLRRSGEFKMYTHSVSPEVWETTEFDVLLAAYQLAPVKGMP